MTLAVFLLMQDGCSKPPIQKLQGFAQGTSYHISYWSESPPNEQKVKADIEMEFEKIDAILSNYRPDSVIEQFNNTENTDNAAKYNSIDPFL